MRRLVAVGDTVYVTLSIDGPVVAVDGATGQTVRTYAGTKGAIVSFTRTLAIELAPKGIRVNAIAPGAVEVENHYKADENYDPAAKGQLIPAGFEGKPSDIAEVALFLASDGARYIVGQTIVVDGGSTSFWCLTDAFKQPSAIRYGKGYVPGIE